MLRIASWPGLAPGPVAWLFAAGLCAQAKDEDLRAAILADRAAEWSVSSRLPVPAVCPVCAGPLRQLFLRDYPGTPFDGPTGETARVCERDALYLWFRHDAHGRDGVLPAGDAYGPSALRLGDVDRALGALPWDALALAAAPLPATPAGFAIQATSADGTVVVGSRHDANLSVWTDREQLIDEDEIGVTGLALAPRGDALAFSRCWGPVRVVALPSGKPLLSVRAPSEWVKMFAFDPELRWLAMGCLRGSGHDSAAVALLDLRTKKQTMLGELGATSPSALAFTDDGAMLACGDLRGDVRLWRTAGAREVAKVELGVPIGALQFSPDGQLLAAVPGNGSELVLLGTSDGAIRARLGRAEEAPPRGAASAAIAFAPGGGIVAWGGGSGVLQWCKVTPPGDVRASFPIEGQSGPRFVGKDLVTTLVNRRVTWDLGKARAADTSPR